MPKAIWLAATLSLVAWGSTAALMLETNGVVSLEQSQSQVFSFNCGGGKIAIRLSVDSRPGTVSFEVRDPAGNLLERQTGGILTIGKWELAAKKTGTYTLLVQPHQTAGVWTVRIESMAPAQLLYQQLLSSALVVILALGCVVIWRLRSGALLRWFWAGAAIWTVGVGLKFLAAWPLNPIFIGSAGHPARFGLGAGIVYCGLMTGIFEIGATLAASLIWRQLSADPGRAVAVGLGAGVFEALLLALAASASCLVALAVGQQGQAIQALGEASKFTPMFWLVGPTERLIAIAAHTASRVLVLRAVALRTWLGFWTGFALLSVVDLLAGVALITGLTKTMSLWWIELMLLPFGVLSLPLTKWAVKRWPQANRTAVPEQFTPSTTA